ncbi:DUF6371 domain-containing protein [Spirosoma utsteinense]|uniref:DUF6371 domain-containing protein n=1 Tax=Spirosoma utsteinense TaxID=2585773 RepID=A0ABR6W1L9_9BACT|nr:DUF6371 domain-containing protein [Spirosoma utsteinense]MBC3784947.1 hypothetical protein [Spirosoma utsteinense]MBC3790445.1 hypothetical protein [Spirosoma utsteinense]
MSTDSLLDQLETDYGTAILSDLTGQHLTRNGQPIRLFDQTKHSAEVFYRADKQGKPYVQDFQQGKRYYPVTAYCQTYGVDYATALVDLRQQYGIDSTPRRSINRTRLSVTEPPLRPVDYLPGELYARCQQQYERNGLYCYLCELFDQPTAHHLFVEYRIGTSRRWQYENALSACLPQFDVAGNLRQVKVIPFHPQTGRRAKAEDIAHRWNPHTRQYGSDPEANKVWFAGKSLSQEKTPNLQQCYFGEHLLSQYPNKRIALVEGESTAIVFAAIWNDYIWLATGGVTGGKWNDPERFEVLRGRNVVLWPDTGKYDEWNAKAFLLQQIGHKVRTSHYLEDNAPPGVTNVDLRDMLTWPRYTPVGGKPIFGEKLSVEPSTNYPPEWDPPGTEDLPILEPTNV